MDQILNLLSALEWTLLFALVVSLCVNLKQRRTNALLRWGYITMSDWCANKIDQMTECAKWMAETTLRDRGIDPTDERIHELLATDIAEAKEAWEKEVDFQMRKLKQNGVSHLTQHDKTLLLSDWVR